MANKCIDCVYANWDKPPTYDSCLTCKNGSNHKKNSKPYRTDDLKRNKGSTAGI